MINNHGTIAAYLDKDAATIRNVVLSASGSVSNFGALNTAWKNLNRCLNVSSSFEKYVAAGSNGYEYLTAYSESIVAYKTIPVSGGTGSFITSSQGSGTTTSTLRGVLCPDGTIYCPPYGSTNAGRYYLPDTDQFLTASGQAAAATNQYASAVLQANGKVFCVPYNMTASRLYDPATRSTTFVGQSKFPGSAAFATGVLLPNGKIFCNPFNSTRAAIWDPDTETTSSSGGVTYTGGSVSHGCVLHPNGKVYSIPFNSALLYIYDYRTNTTTTSSTTYPGGISNAFLGGALLPNGKIFFSPYLSTTGRIYDPETDTVVSGSAIFPGANGYLGCVLIPDGRVLMIPANQTKPGFYNYENHTLTTGSVAWHATTFGFYGGVLMNNGKIFGTGYNSAKNVIHTVQSMSAVNSTLVLSPYLNKGN